MLCHTMNNKIRSKTGITVKLIGENGNIFNLVGKTLKQMRQNGIDQETMDEFENKVYASKSYDEALLVIQDYVEVV